MDARVVLQLVGLDQLQDKARESMGPHRAAMGLLTAETQVGIGQTLSLQRSLESTLEGLVTVYIGPSRDQNQQVLGYCVQP